MKNIIITIIAIIGFNACHLEQVIDVDLEKHESQLVVNCFTKSDQDTVFVHVAKSIGINDNIDSFPLPGTKVQLYENGNLLGETTNYTRIKKYNDWDYYWGNSNPSQYLYPIALSQPFLGNKEYQLKVQADNFPDASATSTMYNKVHIKKSEFISEIDGNATCKIEFDDLSNNKEYYILTGSTKRFFIYDTDTTWIEDNLYLISKDPAVLPEDEYVDYSYLYIDDDTFNGKSKSLIFNFRAHVSDNVQWDFKISAITEDYYNFLISFDKNVDSYDDFESFLFAPEPVIIKSNVKNGFGFFGMSNFSKISINP